MKDELSSGKISHNEEPATVSIAEPASCLEPACCDEERFFRIARAAYFKAEARGFASGCELEDWLIAEAEQQSW